MRHTRTDHLSSELRESMVEFKPKQYMQYIARVAQAIEIQGEYITSLDAAIGDGDHWLNLNIGYQKVVEAISELEAANDFRVLFIGLAKRMMSSMGGTSGALYGSMYLAAAKDMDGVLVLDTEKLSVLLCSWSADIMKRGNVAPEDKTMLDALYPAAMEYKTAIVSGAPVENALAGMKQAAWDGAESTKNMYARRGRASNQAERGLGHIDPGAVTMAIKLDCMADYILENCL